MERQLRLHRADLLAVAERRDCYGAIYIAELCRFEQRKRRNALASGKLESICDQRVILILADFHFVTSQKSCAISSCPSISDRQFHESDDAGVTKLNTRTV